jgi:GNAT superfamily N-acetyltransferase
MEPTLRIGRAKHTNEHLNAILGLIDEARSWLPSKGTMQWFEPWPDKEQRDARVRRALELGATWLVWEMLLGKAVLAATVTVTGKPNPAVWSPLDFDLGGRTVYAHRLITARRYAGWDLGGELLDWTGWRGRDNYGATCIRIDVWTKNERLHDYYLKRGFERRGICRDPEYPSGLLLEKPIGRIPYPMNLQFVESDKVPEIFYAAGPDDPEYVPSVVTGANVTHTFPAPAADLNPDPIAGPSRDFAEPAVREREPVPV